jgi:hypothetical protein
MKRYFDMTEDEKLALNETDLYASVKVEGVHRGIKPPLTLDQAIAQVGYTGFTIPADAVAFYELTVPGEYSHNPNTGTNLCFKTQAEAERALVGAIVVVESGYNEGRHNKIVGGSPGVRAVWVTQSKQKSLFTKLEELKQDNTDFEKLAEECRDDLSRIRQERYNTRVRSEKRKQYLELAQGNEEIAKSFWAKTEGTDFPAA